MRRVTGTKPVQRLPTDLVVPRLLGSLGLNHSLDDASESRTPSMPDPAAPLAFIAVGALSEALAEAGNRMLGSRPQSRQSVNESESVSRSGEGQLQRLATTRTPSAATRQLSPGGSDDSTPDRPTGPDHRSLSEFSIGNMGFLYTDAPGGCLATLLSSRTLPGREVSGDDG